jgi:hypothetical protein
MRRAAAFFLILLFSFTLLFAQANENPPEDAPDGGDWDYINSDTYTHGDQTFIISIATIFPTVFFNQGKQINVNFNPPVGGAGSLSYNYFFNSNIFLGGEVSGTFIPTLGNNMYYGILLGARTGYQFYVWKLEFPLNISVGMVWHRYLDSKNYGFYLKGGGAAYFRYNSEWSFGVHSNWYWLPQKTGKSSENVDGNMIDLLLSVRYHF